MEMKIYIMDNCVGCLKELLGNDKGTNIRDAGLNK